MTYKKSLQHIYKKLLEISNLIDFLTENTASTESMKKLIKKELESVGFNSFIRYTNDPNRKEIEKLQDLKSKVLECARNIYLFQSFLKPDLANKELD